MKHLIRHFVYDTFALFAVSRIADGMIFDEGVKTFLLAGLGVTVGLILVKPILNILLLPINLVTFGFFRWVSSAVSLYIVTLLVAGFKIMRFHLEPLSSKWIDVPEINFTGVLAFVGFSFIMSFIISFAFWIRK